MKTNRSSATKAVLLPVIAFILCFVICFSVTYTVAHAASNVTFTDVPSTHWAYNDITEAASLGFINGYDDGRFGPNDSLTREQWAALIVRTLGSNVETGDHQPQGKHSFTTANASAWAIPELVKAENSVILTNTFNQMNETEATANNNGNSPGLDNRYVFLNYKKAITRHEAAAMLGGAFTWTSIWKTYDSDHTPNATTRAKQFSDCQNLGELGHCIGVCANAGIINGYPDGSFGLKNNLTRAEAAAMLMRWYRMMPKDLDAIKTAGSVTWKTTQYTTFAILTSL